LGLLLFLEDRARQPGQTRAGLHALPGRTPLAFSFLLVIQVLSWTAPTWATRVQWKIPSGPDRHGGLRILTDKIGFVLVTLGFVILLMKVIEPQLEEAVLEG
jgi:hypothetical protein